MPNFWSSTSQKIYEVFYGPRTKDIEFDQKLEEVKTVEKSMLAIKSLFVNFHHHTAGIKQMCQEVYTFVPNAYGENSPYWNQAREIADTHKEIEQIYNNLLDSINIICSQTTEWDKLFTDVKSNLTLREEKRRVYDHYDSKMEKLVKDRNDKASRNMNENPKDVEKFERNDLKYKKATDDFIKISGFAFNQMQELLDYRYKLINPVVVSFIVEEKRFFESVANLFKKFERISQSFQALDRGFQKTPNNYDPTRYVRANRLLLGINANELPPVKSKEKYSFQDYLNSKGGNKPSDKSGGNTNINNMTFGNRGSNYGGNFNPYQNPNLNNQQSFTSNNYNNPYEQPKVDNTNPYSYEAYKARINPSSNQNKTNISSNANNEFTVFENSFSNKNKSQMRDQNDMRQTTVVPPTDMYTMSQKGEQYNPYSSISLGDQSNVTNPRPSNPNYSVLSNNQYMTQPGVEPQIGNYSQMTPNQFNYNNNNPNNSYRNSSYPTPDNNLKFPK